MTTPHKWAEVIHAFAEGKEIQWKRDWGKWPTDWMDYKGHSGPGFDSAVIWRIKPQKKTYWVNIYKGSSIFFGSPFKDEETCRKSRDRSLTCIKTISFDIEE